MKLTLQRLKEIVAEEVIKEDLAPEHAIPAISAMLKGADAPAVSDIFGDVFSDLYGEEALEGEEERRAAQEAGEEPEEEDFPTEYQAGGAQGDRPVIKPFSTRSIDEIIREELEAILNEIKND
jgi:hypothetical protein